MITSTKMVGLHRGVAVLLPHAANLIDGQVTSRRRSSTEGKWKNHTRIQHKSTCICKAESSIPPTPQKQQKMTNSSKQVTTVVIRFFRIPQRPQDGIPTSTIRHAPQVRMLTRVAGNTGHWRPNHLRHPVQASHDPYIVHPESSPH